MKVALAKKEIEMALSSRFGRVFEVRDRNVAEVLPTGIAEIDHVLEGIPRGAITEVHGQESSGRTSLLLSALAVATDRQESCAVIDCSDTFALNSAAKAGVDFNRLLWVRCQDNLERAFKAVDLLLHGGGFGFVALNLSDVPARLVRRVIAAWWFRFRRALENTPTALIVITPLGCIKSCAAVALELKKEAAVWPSTLSLVSENVNSSFTNQRTGETRRLSLVRAPAASPSTLTHAHFIENFQVHVHRQRPLEPLAQQIKFQARLT